MTIGKRILLWAGIVIAVVVFGRFIVGPGVKRAQEMHSDCLARGYADVVTLGELGETWCIGQREGRTVTERIR